MIGELEVWKKGKIIKNYNPVYWRKDDYGNVVSYRAYGNQESIYGWHKDHIKPVSKGGKNDIDNLRPLQWAENISKSDNFPYRKTGKKLGKSQVPKNTPKNK
jgi:HNH endonuclease